MTRATRHKNAPAQGRDRLQGGDNDGTYNSRYQGPPHPERRTRGKAFGGGQNSWRAQDRRRACDEQWRRRGHPVGARYRARAGRTGSQRAGCAGERGDDAQGCELPGKRHRRRYHGDDDQRQVPSSARGRGRARRRADLDRRHREVARAGIRERAGSPARIYQDGLIARLHGAWFSLLSDASTWIASCSESIARSAARVPNSISSDARWKSNQPISPTRGVINRSGGSPASRARVMRSCMMLKASTMIEEMPGRPPPPKNSRFTVRSGEKNLPKRRLGIVGWTDTSSGAALEPCE